MEKLLNIIEKITPLITIIISSLISYIVAKLNAKSEVKNALLNNQREDEISVREAFSALMAALEDYHSFSCGINHLAAIKANSDFLSIAPSCCRPILLKIANALDERQRDKAKKLGSELLAIYSEHIENSTQNTKNKQ